MYIYTKILAMCNSSNIVAEWREKEKNAIVQTFDRPIGIRRIKWRGYTRRFRPILYFCNIAGKGDEEREWVRLVHWTLSHSLNFLDWDLSEKSGGSGHFQSDSECPDRSEWLFFSKKGTCQIHSSISRVRWFNRRLRLWRIHSVKAKKNLNSKMSIRLSLQVNLHSKRFREYYCLVSLSPVPHCIPLQFVHECLHVEDIHFNF